MKKGIFALFLLESSALENTTFVFVNDPVERILLPLTYFGPISYFRRILKGHSVILEIHEHYIKQTYRNRCRIATANGTLDLIIPVIKVFGNHTPIKDIQIEQHQKWQLNHWRAIQSAYSNAPFFIYYEPDLEPFFNKKFTSLAEYNLEILRVIMHFLGIQKELKTTDRYVVNPGSDVLDLRNEFNPKKDPGIKNRAYTQVFSEKWGFFQDLSILDLLFNLGPTAKSYLSE